MRSNLTLHVATLELFVTSLSAGLLARIEGILDELVRDIKAGRKEPSVVSACEEENDETAWSELDRELFGDGITRNDVAKYKDEIKEYLKKLVRDNMMEDRASSISSSLHSSPHWVKEESIVDREATVPVSQVKPSKAVDQPLVQPGSILFQDNSVKDMSEFVDSTHHSPPHWTQNVGRVAEEVTVPVSQSEPSNTADEKPARRYFVVTPDHILIVIDVKTAKLRDTFKMSISTIKRSAAIFEIIMTVLERLNINHCVVRGVFECSVRTSVRRNFTITIWRLPLLGNVHALEFGVFNESPNDVWKATTSPFKNRSALIRKVKRDLSRSL